MDKIEKLPNGNIKVDGEEYMPESRITTVLKKWGRGDDALTKDQRVDLALDLLNSPESGEDE